MLLTIALASLLQAQSPMPVIVPAMTPAIKSAPAAPAPSEKSVSLQAALKMLQEVKATNEETLRKQAATLQQLDELEKAADAIRLLSKRS
jgi:hypothetical protein